MNFIKSILFCCCFSTITLSQISDSLHNTYYSQSIPVSHFDKSVLKQLSAMKDQSPYFLFTQSAMLINEKKLDEASLYYLAGRMNFELFNLDKSAEKEDEHLAAFSSLNYMLKSSLQEYWNSNLTNYAGILKQFNEWFKNNRPKYASSKEAKKTHQKQLTEINDFIELLEQKPMQYIDLLELQKRETEEFIDQVITDEEFEDEEFEDETTELENQEKINSEHRLTEEIQMSFLVYDCNLSIIKNMDFTLFAVANAYHDTYLEANGATIQQQENPLVYTVNPGNSDEFSIAVYGVNTETEKKYCLGVYKFYTVDSIVPKVYFDGFSSGSTIVYKSGELLCNRLDFYSDFKKLPIQRWELVCGTIHFEGTGEILTKEAEIYIQQLAIETPFIIKVYYQNQQNEIKVAKGIYSK